MLPRLNGNSDPNRLNTLFPPDYVNQLRVFAVAVVFGCFAGLTYWWPKAFGFTLNETWGKRAFWFWIIGFFVAFMPLYVLGFMGMTRRLSQQIDPQFHPMLVVAACGAALIACGILCQLIQFYVSIRDREQNRDLTGDPWGGRTLEWATSSPPPFYNFAIVPVVHERDAFWEMKEKGDDLLVATLEPIQQRYNELITNKYEITNKHEQ